MRRTMLLLMLVGALLLVCIGVVLAQQTAPDPSQPSAKDAEYADEVAGETPVESGLATGVVEKPEVTFFQYGTHTVTDEASGLLYALKSESVDLDAYVGQQIIAYGTLVPGYENGQIEGGPPLLNVTRVEPV